MKIITTAIMKDGSVKEYANQLGAGHRSAMKAAGHPIVGNVIETFKAFQANKDVKEVTFRIVFEDGDRKA